MARGTPVRFRDWSGGLNLSAGVYDLTDRESPAMLNMLGSPRGAIRKRDGWADQTTGTDLPEQLVGMYPLHLPGVTTLVAISANRCLALTPGTAPVVLSGAWALGQTEWAQGPVMGGQGPLYGMTAALQPVVANATSTNFWTAATGTLPAGTKVLYAGNRMWVAGMTAYTPSGGSAVTDAGSTLVFSALGDPRTWPASNVVQFDPGDGEAITALGTVGPYLLVFKPNKVWIVYDLDTGANRKLSLNIGTRSHRTVVETPLGTFFLDPDQGVMLTNGSTVKRVGRAIDPDLRLIAQQYLVTAAAGFWNGHYYLSVPIPGINNPAVTYDLDTTSAGNAEGDPGSWWKHDFASWQFAVTDFPQIAGSKDELLYGTLANTLRWARFMVPNQPYDRLGAASNPITFQWRSAPHILDGQVATRKRVNQIRMDGRGQVSVFARRDFAQAADPIGMIDFTPQGNGLWEVNDSTLWEVDDGMLWEGSASLTQQDINSVGRARTWALEFQGSTITDFELDSYTMLVGPHRATD